MARTVRPPRAPLSILARGSVFGTTLATLALVFAACSADGSGDTLVDTLGSGTEPPPSAVLPPSSGGEGGSASDGGKDTGASKDAKADTGVDAGKPAPAPGSACAKLDEIFTRACGACGKQEALCLPKPGGGAGVVSDYSACAGELAGGCVPGTVENEPCGNCGTRKRTCNPYCAWTTSACGGEPPGACTPTAQDYTAAGCASAGTVRTRACGASCGWSAFSASCEALDFKLTVAPTAGESVSAIYPLRAAMADKRLSSTCPNGYFSTAASYPYVYVELVNPTAQTLTLSAWNTVAQAGGPIIDTTMTWYASSERPTDDASRKACAKGMGESCPSGLPCGDYRWAGLTGTTAITIPPSASVTLFFGSASPVGGSAIAEGNVKLVVRTDTAL